MQNKKHNLKILSKERKRDNDAFCIGTKRFRQSKNKSCVEFNKKTVSVL